MKKYLLGLFAVALAIGISSYTLKTDPLIKYQGTTFGQTDVQTLSNWKKVTSVTCLGSNKACDFVVPSAYVDINGNLTNVTISAILGANGIDYTVDHVFDATTSAQIDESVASKP